MSSALCRARASGARLSLRAGQPKGLAPELQPYTVKAAAVKMPLTAVDRDIFWYGGPWPGDGKLDHLSVRVSGERVCRNLIYLLEMDLRKGLVRGRFAGLKAYVESRLTCPRCGALLTVRAGAKGGHFLGYTAYPRCRLPAAGLTLEELEGYLAVSGLTCPADHLLKAVPSKRGPLTVCSHSPACRCAYQFRDLL